MLMVAPDDGKLYFLQKALIGGTAEDWEVQLYSNNYTPLTTSVPGDFTPATFTGSGIWTVAVLDWSAPVIVGGIAEATAIPPPEWTHGGGASQTVYGWFAVGATSGDMKFAQRFDTARNMSPGSIESLDPFTIKLQDIT